MRTIMSRPRAHALTLAALLSAGSLALAAPPAVAGGEVYPTPSDGVFQMKGSGWGHGRGMSQWGAHQAASEGRTYQEILDFYYPGTSLAKLPGAKVRVLLSSDTDRNLVVRAVPGLRAMYDQGGHHSVRLPARPSGCSADASRWRARAGAAGMRLDAKCRGRWTNVKRELGPTVSFRVPRDIVATANGRTKRGYRGVVSGTFVSTSTLQVINKVPMKAYLRPVVAAEVSYSWPVESLRAQAIAARSYAAAEMRARTSSSFDVYDWVRSQAYPGAVEYGAKWSVTRVREFARTDAAIADTAAVYVTTGGAPALTQFSSSNGGATAATPVAHMGVEVDPWDSRSTKNPRLNWTDSVTVGQLGRLCSGAGEIESILVLSREGAGRWGGRIARLKIVGADRSCELSGDSALRSGLGIYSSMFTFTS
jgi:SpoIID/LytB domain protein